MAYAPANVILFLAENRHFVGDRAPHTVARAFKEVENYNLGFMFPGYCVVNVFEGRSNVAREFAMIVQSDIRHQLISLGQQQLGIEHLLLALFGGIPEELDHFFEGKQVGDDIDAIALFKEMGALLRSHGVDWEDRWVISDSAAEE